MIAFLLLAALALPSECLHIGSLYWEIGDANGTIEYGIRGSTVHAETVMPIASATKWLFAADVAETGKERGQGLTANDFGLHGNESPRLLLKRELSEFLGTDPAGENAVYSPAPASWRSSYGHWIEDDGSYSSPGAFGFYPWLSGKTYGVVARSSTSRQGYFESAVCGRALRGAFEAAHK
jgi:hypothetical protein